MLGLVRLHEKKKKSKKKAKCLQLRCRLRPLLSGFTVHCTKHYGQTMQTSAAPMALKSDQPAVVEEQHVSFSQNWTLLTLQENMMTRHHRGPQQVGSSDWLQWTSWYWHEVYVKGHRNYKSENTLCFPVCVFLRIACPKVPLVKKLYL